MEPVEDSVVDEHHQPKHEHGVALVMEDMAGVPAGGQFVEALARVSYYEAAALDFAGIRIKRHYKVGGGFNFIFEFIS